MKTSHHLKSQSESTQEEEDECSRYREEQTSCRASTDVTAQSPTPTSKHDRIISRRLNRSRNGLLDLSRQGLFDLSGLIPLLTSRSNFASLRVLSLASNRLANLPSDLFFVLPRLEELDISNNLFGCLPWSTCGDLQVARAPSLLPVSLRILHAQRNKIKRLSGGQLSSALQLEHLNLSGNLLHDDKSLEELSSLRTLRSLDLSANRLKSVPVGLLSWLHRLERLSLSANSLQCLDEDLFQLAGPKCSLQELYLDSNKVQLLPTSVEVLVNLETLSMMSNRLRTLPVSLSNLSKSLREVCVTHNLLKAIPWCLLQLTRLKTLKLSHNPLCQVPAAIGNLVALEQLHLDGCCIQTCPSQLRKLPRLSILSLRHNLLQYIPREIPLSKGALHDLHVVGNPLLIPPPAVARNGLQSMRDFFQHLSEGDASAGEVKVLVLGSTADDRRHVVESLLRGQEKRVVCEGGGVTIYQLKLRLTKQDTSQPGKEGLPLINVVSVDCSAAQVTLQHLFITDRTIVFLVANVGGPRCTDAVFSASLENWLEFLFSIGCRCWVRVVCLMNSCVVRQSQATGRKALLQGHIRKKINNLMLSLQRDLTVASAQPLPESNEGVEEWEKNVLAAEHRLVNYPVVSESVTVCCLDNTEESAETLRDVLTVMIGNEADLAPSTIPNTWQKLRTKLQCLSSTKPVMDWKILAALAREFGLEERNFPAVLGYWHEAGALFNFQQSTKLREIIIADPTWLACAVSLLSSDSDPLRSAMMQMTGPLVTTSERWSKLSLPPCLPAKTLLSFLHDNLASVPVAYPKSVVTATDMALVPCLLPTVQPAIVADHWPNCANYKEQDELVVCLQVDNCPALFFDELRACLCRSTDYQQHWQDGLFAVSRRHWLARLWCVLPDDDKDHLQLPSPLSDADVVTDINCVLVVLAMRGPRGACVSNWTFFLALLRQATAILSESPRAVCKSFSLCPHCVKECSPQLVCLSSHVGQPDQTVPCRYSCPVSAGSAFFRSHLLHPPPEAVSIEWDNGDTLVRLASGGPCACLQLDSDINVCRAEPMSPMSSATSHPSIIVQGDHNVVVVIREVFFSHEKCQDDDLSATGRKAITEEDCSSSPPTQPLALEQEPAEAQFSSLQLDRPEADESPNQQYPTVVLGVPPGARGLARTLENYGQDVRARVT